MLTSEDGAGLVKLVTPPAQLQPAMQTAAIAIQDSIILLFGMLAPGLKPEGVGQKRARLPLTNR